MTFKIFWDEHKDIIKVFLPILLISIAAILAVILTSNTATVGQSPLYVGEGYAWKGLSKEPVEVIMMMFVNGHVYTFTLNSETSTVFSVEYLTKTKKEKISDLVFCIHNHLFPGTFSEADIKSYYRLKENGFRGFYLLLWPGGRVTEYRGN